MRTRMNNVVLMLLTMLIIKQVFGELKLVHSSNITSSKLRGVSNSVATNIDIPYLWRYGGPYGYYCGLGHTSRLFVKPIDKVDRACQIHDTCISAAGRYLDCYCNEQLLNNIYEVCPVNDDAKYYRGQIIRAMNIGTSNCDSLCNFKDVYMLSSDAGYNGAPFYESGYYEVELLDDKTVSNSADSSNNITNLAAVMFTPDELSLFAIENIRDYNEQTYKRNKTYRPITTGINQVYVPPGHTMLVLRPATRSVGCVLAGCNDDRKKYTTNNNILASEVVHRETIVGDDLPIKVRVEKMK